MNRLPKTRLLRWTSLSLLMLAIARPAGACTIPVFRYAFERWDLSPYELVVFHRGALSQDERAVLASVPGTANLVASTVDLDGKVSPALRKLWECQQPTATLPRVVLRRADAGTKTAWTGPLTATALRRLIDSPARQKIVSALSQGDAGVFVVLLSGNRDADDAATALVRRELAKLEKLVKLPEQRGDGPRIKLALPLKVGFTVLPLKRDEPGEEVLIELLLSSETGLARASGPMVFPVFGRGRVLGSMYGKDLDGDNVLFDVVSFLCGECSCQVKEMNPGFDLAIAADWPAIFARIGPAVETGPETPLGATRNAARVKPIVGPLAIVPGGIKPAGASEVHVAVSHYPPTVSQPEPANGAKLAAMAPPHRRWLWGATIAAGLLVVVTGAWACVLWWRGGSQGTS
jgi:hypothetical protein